MINNELYQKIYDEIEPFLPDDWNKTVIYFECGDASYNIEFYIKINGVYIKCYDIPAIDEDKLLETFDEIYSFVSPERNKINDKWTNMTFVVDCDGNMKAEFDYTDLSNNAYSFSVAWKNKYLV